MKSSGVGGQAVLEGVMMKNKEKYAIAVRKPDKEIVTTLNEYHGIGEKISFFKLPVIRGVVAFVESMVIGMKTLTYSASFFEEEEKNQSTQNTDTKQEKKINSLPEGLVSAFTVIFAILLAVGIFMVLPFLISQLLNKVITSQRVLTIIEGVIRIVLFVGYILVISMMEDIKRFFMYHGAEHKVINCIENGYELTVENVKKRSKHHKRCGTSFTLIVVFLSVIFFMFINVSSPVLRLVLRLLLVPVIAGVSYEFIRLAGRSDNKIVTILSKPGFLLQRLTTKEPDDSMIEVAIASLEAVFDWRSFVNGNEIKSANIKNIKRKKGKIRNTLESESQKLTKVSTLTEEDESDGLDKVFEQKVMKEETNAEKVLRQQNFMKSRARSDAFNINAEKANEEDDEVLSALDKFFGSEEDSDFENNKEN